MLSDAKIRAAKPNGRNQKLADSHGLYLYVKTNGAKLWRYKFRQGGVEGVASLGSYPQVSLAQARDAHQEARRLVAKGLNPVTESKERKQALAREALERKQGLFFLVAEDWLASTSSGLRPASCRQRRREMDKNIFPTFKHRGIASITRVELSALVKSIEKRAPEVARNVRGYLWSIFEHAIESGLLDANPVPSNRVLKKRNQANHAALSTERLATFYKSMNADSPSNLATQTAMKLVILTACRKHEVIGGEWSEIDLKKGVWEIPAIRMKAGRPHWVPLSTQAVALLTELKSLAGRNSRFLFPNRRDSDRPMANRTLNAMMIRCGFGEDGTPHGMRATFSTHFNGRNANPDVVELCLAHLPMGKTRAAYNRHEYMDERRAILQDWADYLDQLK